MHTYYNTSTVSVWDYSRASITVEVDVFVRETKVMDEKLL